MPDKPRYTFHYTPVEYFDSLDPAADYYSPEFDEDGFIHCTDGANNMAATANLHYRNDLRPFYALYIDKTLVSSPIKYEHHAGMYPHIYGPLNREAIVRILVAPREIDGSFLPITATEIDDIETAE
jgi:uncharacterized protein (DUF952 family)